MSKQICQVACVAFLLTVQSAFASELVQNDPGAIAQLNDQGFRAAVRAAGGSDMTPPPACPTNPCGDLKGVGFGVALGVAMSPETNVTSTTVQNNVVRLTGGSKADLGFWFELHHYWGLGTGELVSNPMTGAPKIVYNMGLGPFLGIQVGTDSKIIQAIGLGLMFGMRTTQDSKTALNIGVGYAARQISVLTNGLTFDQPLPTGVTAVTTRTKIVSAPMIITSFAF